MTKQVTIFGGSGFVGRYVAQQMAKAGWRVRVAVRRPNEAIFVKPYGTVGQVEPILCNIRNAQSVAQAVRGVDAIVNCVGLLNEIGANTFEAVHVDGAAQIAELAKAEGVASLVHISAIGADPDGASNYLRSKGRGEQAVKQHFPNAVILRPSVIFGSEDGFFNKFAGMTRFGPILPLVGADSLMQPVYVNDVASAVVAGVTGQAKPGIYELGGPDAASLSGLIAKMLTVIEKRRLVVSLPFWVGGLIAGIVDAVQGITLGLVPNNLLTRDQVKSLRQDAVVTGEYPGFAELGIAPVAMDVVLPDYLWPYRPAGQFASIKSSAGNLKT